MANYNRIQTDRRGCGCGQYSGDADSVGGDRVETIDFLVGMGTKYFTVSSSNMNMGGSNTPQHAHVLVHSRKGSIFQLYQQYQTFNGTI